MIKLLIIDVDGIMTTGIKYYNREGEVKLKTFCDKDWTSIKRFRAAGINVVFLTGDGYNKKILEVCEGESQKEWFITYVVIGYTHP